MQSGKDPDYATGKTKRNGTAGTERSRQTRNATGKPGTERNCNRQTRKETGKTGTQPADPERNRRYGTQPADPECYRQN